MVLLTGGDLWFSIESRVRVVPSMKGFYPRLSGHHSARLSGRMDFESSETIKILLFKIYPFKGGSS